jgi:hypothetical protein
MYVQSLSRHTWERCTMKTVKIKLKWGEEFENNQGHTKKEWG